ncbi:metallopeptidase family protein [Bifidobacterium lemurum]|nr:metallopeptidase family protein [Bifidobacterium lemurum]
MSASAYQQLVCMIGSTMIHEIGHRLGLDDSENL